MKIFNNEKETHNFLALLAIGSVIIGLFTLMLNIYGTSTCAYSFPCMPDGSPQITIVSMGGDMGVPSLPPQSSKAYQAYASTHVWATTTPKTPWEKDEFQTFQSGLDKCFIATTSIPIYFPGGLSKEISFNYALCQSSSPLFYPNGEPGTIYADYMSENSQTRMGSLAFKYWFLKKGESPESLIGQIMKYLPTPMQRDHCTLNSQSVTKARTPKSEIKHYSVSPDSEYQKVLGEDGFEWAGACYPYNGYFQVVGDALVYIYNGQDVHLFDPDSMKVSDFITYPRVQP